MEVFKEAKKHEKICTNWGGGEYLRLLHGFTLSEVLITLGIIGVVAAMTLPSLITKYEKQVTVNRLKVAYQMFSDVIQQAITDNGGEIILSEDILSSIETSGNNSVISQQYIDPYIKGVKKYSGKRLDIKNKAGNNLFVLGYINDDRAAMCTPNGFCYWVINHGTNYCYLVVDINGPKNPNIVGRDVFVFDINGTYKPGLGYNDISLPHPILKVYSGYSNIEEVINEFCSNTSSSFWNGRECFTKIVRDGWEIKDDYPW